MRPLPLLLGVALGLGAIALAWTRAPHDADSPLAAGSGVAAREQGPSGGPVPTGAGTGSAPAPATAGDVEALRARALLLPVAGFDRRGLRDEFSDARTGHVHEALDLLAPRGTPVLAADDGFVAKLFTSARGGLTVYQFDPTQTYCYYYAHLDAYAPGLHEGATLDKGSLLGFVGTTGNSPPGTPHLHFAIFRLGPEKRWWQGTPIDPFPVWAQTGLAARAASGPRPVETPTASDSRPSPRAAAPAAGSRAPPAGRSTLRPTLAARPPPAPPTITPTTAPRVPPTTEPSTPPRIAPIPALRRLKCSSCGPTETIRDCSGSVRPSSSTQPIEREVELAAARRQARGPRTLDDALHAGARRDHDPAVGDDGTGDGRQDAVLRARGLRGERLLQPHLHLGTLGHRDLSIPPLAAARDVALQRTRVVAELLHLVALCADAVAVARVALVVPQLTLEPRHVAAQPVDALLQVRVARVARAQVLEALVEVVELVLQRLHVARRRRGGSLGARRSRQPEGGAEHGRSEYRFQHHVFSGGAAHRATPAPCVYRSKNDASDDGGTPVAVDRTSGGSLARPRRPQ